MASKPKDSKDKDVVTEKTGSAPHVAAPREEATARVTPSVTFPPESNER